jgi:hypothetical protein
METKPPREPVRSKETTGTITANQRRPFSGSRLGRERMKAAEIGMIISIKPA